MSCGNPTDTLAMSKLAFGVELELFVSPRKNIEGTLFSDALARHGWCEYVLSSPDDASSTLQQRGNRLALRRAIAECLRNEGSLRVADPQMEVYPHNYEEWVLAPETLREPPRFWGMEIISRVLSTDQSWQKELDTIFRVITKYCDVMVTPSCGMHVHVSPGRDIPYTTGQLVAICKGLSYYNDATTAVLPGDRKDNAYAKPNVLAKGWAFDDHNASIREKFQAVSTQSWTPLFQILDKICPENIYDIMYSYGKQIAWNFRNLLHEGTIEFRRPPGVDSARGAKHWAAFVLALFSAAVSTEWNEATIQERLGHPTVSELHRFLNAGLRRLGDTCQGALVNEWLAEDSSVAMTDEEKQTLFDGWHAENDDIKREWNAQGIIYFEHDPASDISSSDDSSSTWDTASDYSSLSTTDGAWVSETGDRAEWEGWVTSGSSTNHLW